MPTFKIYGADAQTGEDVAVTVQASDPAEAEAIASHLQIMVSKLVELAPPPEVSPAIAQAAMLAEFSDPMCQACGSSMGTMCQACGSSMEKTVQSGANCMGLIIALLVFAAGMAILGTWFWTGIGAIIGGALMIWALFECR